MIFGTILIEPAVTHKHSYQIEAKSIMLGLREAEANLILSSPAAADTKWGN